jgi:hypothetical protein
MSDVSFDLSSAIFSKSVIGQQEIQTRALNLPPMVRRVLVMVDGKKSNGELAAFVAGHPIDAILSQLLEQGCIEGRVVAPAAPVKSASTKVAAPLQASDDLSRLPPPEARSAKDRELSRTFMTNTTNTMFGQNMRLTLIQAIHDCKTVEDLRKVYLSWAETMASSSIGAKRLPELRKSLFQYL